MLTKDSMNKSVVSEETTIAEVFEILNETALGIAFVRGKDQRIIGCISDGDLRRALLEDPSLDRPVGICCNREFVHVTEGTPREKVLKLLDARIRVIPILLPSFHARVSTSRVRRKPAPWPRRRCASPSAVAAPT